MLYLSYRLIKHISYSVGIVQNFDDPSDYAGIFYDVNLGYNGGLDYCFGPLSDGSRVNALSMTFGSGYNFGARIDYYFGPCTLFKRGIE